ncbi:hypothetical protein SASPL_112161 [Salvia splendens]|uniref:S1 motif domain-containing protein n=1 Tax=Salvia splendens TaxID=180675 RepID=A0A8X8YAR4_SALSN|nr:hypothetical protein SASPL_112161 [Salvia splendens]
MTMKKTMEVRDEYEKDGFIVDDIEEGEDEEEDRVDSDEEQKKRKRKKRDQFMLDEDDYELLQESNISVNRPMLVSSSSFVLFIESKKFKRLKKARKEAEEEPSRFSDEEEFNGSGKVGRTGEEKLKHSLFGDDYGQSLEDIAEEDGLLEEEEDADVGEEDEMADFIVDEEVDEIPVRRKKPKKSGQLPGISSSALQEAHEIFGDVEDLLRLRKIDVRGRFGETSESSLEDQFDPSVLSEKYMTEKDDQIREIDIPERMQISEGSTGHPPTDEFSVKMETEWICNQLVPFIAMYRKEEILSLLKDPTEPETGIETDINQKPALKWHQVLWAIQDLDQKWLLLLKRKSALQSYYIKLFEEEKRRVYDETRLRLNEQLFQSIIKSLEAVDLEREVDDVDSKFNLHFPTGLVLLDEGQFKRPKRKSHYSICSKAGLWEVASKFGYSSEQFGLCRYLWKKCGLCSFQRMDELEDAKETPEEMASNFTCTMFETPQAVLKGARHMAAVEISFEPCVRKHVRSIFMDNAVVSTSPTPDGNTAIDSFHQFYGIKWLRDKPLNRFEDAQWLLIQKAEEEKLLQLWNEQRKLILNDALNNFLLPSMGKEARSLLTSRAKSWLLSDYGRLLWDKVSVAPYQRKENDARYDEETAPRIMFKMVEDNPRDVGHEMDNLNVVFCDESLPHLYENSRVSVDQLPSQEAYLSPHPPPLPISGTIRRAVGLGRHLQNPLAMVATLCGPGKERLSWKLNPLENFLTPDEKYGMVEQVMVDVTNQVGLDINLAATYEWLFAPLHFICGLGPRKAASLQRSLVRAGAIFTRKDLLQSQGLGKKVFINAVGFLRVRRSGLTSSSSLFIDLLDETRVHPESYILAQDLANDIYLEDGNDDDDVLEMAIEHVREKPHLLRAVDVHEYAEQKNHPNKKETLNDIRLELMEGFQDRRRPFAEPCQDELLHMITGETEEALSEGRIVQATVRNVQARRASCVLESGLTGILSKEDYMDDWRDIHDLSNKLCDGDILTCRIKSIQKNCYQVFLTCRESDMRSNRYQSRRMTDPYYHEERSTLPSVQEKARKEKELAKKRFKPRMIVHPHFQNIMCDAAIKDPGESVIRPSSLGPSFFTLTMKVYDGVYATLSLKKAFSS